VSKASDKLLIRGGAVLDIEDDPHNPEVGDILIENGRILEVRRAKPISADDAWLRGASVIDARDKLVTPGFVNGHYHSHDMFLKGSFEPSILEFWAINALPRAYPPRSDREIRLRTLLGAVECVRSGITTTQDMLTLFPLSVQQVGVVKDAYRTTGLRCVLALQVADVSPLNTVPFWRSVIPPELQPLLAGPPPPPDSADPLTVMQQTIARTTHRSRGSP
jgi:guanine deaminase